MGELCTHGIPCDCAATPSVSSKRNAVSAASTGSSCGLSVRCPTRRHTLGSLRFEAVAAGVVRRRADDRHDDQNRRGYGGEADKYPSAWHYNLHKKCEAMKGPSQLRQRRLCVLCARPQDDFDDAVFLVPELLIHFRRVLQARGMRDYKARINFAGDDFFEKRLCILLHMRLAHFDR